MEEGRKIVSEKVRRNKVVIFLTKNMIPISLVMVLVTMQLLGFWDIKRYTVIEREGKDINPVIYSQLEEYIDERILGENFFLFAPQRKCSDITKDFPYLESVRIEKVFPNKIVVNVKLYEEGYVALLKNSSCYITSNHGVVLQEICIEEEENCCQDYALGNVPLISSPESEPSYILKDVRKFLLVGDLDKLRRVVESYGYKVSDIVVDGEIIDLRDTDGRVSRFNIATDLETQMSRYLVVVAKALSDGLEYTYVDLRFERPVMKL